MKNQSVGLDEPEPNARGEHVRLRKCKRCSEKRESPGFIRGESQIAMTMRVAERYTDTTGIKIIVYEPPEAATREDYAESQNTEVQQP